MPNGFMYPGGSGSGFGSAKMMITLFLSDGSSPAGITVTVTETGTEKKFAEFTYGEQPITLDVPAHFQYRVTVSEKDGYKTPEPVEGVAEAKALIPIVLTYKFGRRYGFRRTINESDPDARIEYLYDAKGKTPFTMDLGTGTPNYGDWEAFINEVATPVMLKNDGTEDYELDRNDQTQKAEGGASDISNADYEGNAMVRFAKWKWVHRSEDETYQYVIFSDVQYDDTYHAYAHTDANGVVQDRFYWGMYKGSFLNNKLRSIADAAIMTRVSLTTSMGRARENGDGYDTGYKSGWDYISDLLTLISKNDNSHGVFGNGYRPGNSSGNIDPGSTKKYGGFWGSSALNKDVKVFWIEGYWGNALEGVHGLFCEAGSGTIKIKMTPPYDASGIGYHDTGIKPALSSSLDYVKLSSCSDLGGFVPRSVGGSESTYVCDIASYRTSQNACLYTASDYRNAYTGGSRTMTLYYSYDGTSASPILSARLSFIPIT